MYGKYIAIAFLIDLVQCTQGLRVNMTMFANCQDVDIQYSEADVALTKVSYDRDADGVCNTIHAEYHVRKPSDDVEWELVITSYKCPLGSTTICLENPQEYVEPMHCDRFHSDDTGPWFMLSSSMTNGDRCGRVEGFYNLDAAVLKINYLHRYLELGKGTYRVRMLFHVPGTGMEQKNMKGCCEMDFDVID
ncbi:uncharacterized protein LOC129778766 [Toxorhynchites rutilus septentrionalis]|uniref:uncharacterized protein LOC129778766 n=1 Tax=Toxorhynchites rutilus septentrionalis TaxID=329112 RepID=UPI00247AD7CA|nr:uncharacterized protein LOC129778766 [Toxorhynchites rutilus septentrionalis]